MAFPFLRLPIEIRDCIYKLVLTSPEPIVLRPQKRQQRRRSTLRSGRALRPAEEQDDRKVLEGRSQLAILFTCRQVYNEAVLNYYRMNTFYTEDVKVLEEFMDTIGEECRKEVASMDLSLCMSRVPLKLLPQLTGLRKLSLNFYLFQFGASPFRFCESMESLEVLKLAPYWKCDELHRRWVEAFVKLNLSNGADSGQLEAMLDRLEDSVKREVYLILFPALS